MAEKTGIHWADATWNPWMGCKMVSPGCAKCYMFREMNLYGRNPNAVVRTSFKTFRSPLNWARTKKVTDGARIFTCSWSDWFIDKADEWREEAWKIVHDTPQYTYMILTKRPERILDHLPKDWGDGYPNVWLGVSAENQDMADLRIPLLMAVPVKVRWISAEPLLGRIDFERYLYLSGSSTAGPWRDALGRHRGGGGIGGQMISSIPSGDINWVITGGESDPAPRACDPDWVRSIRDQCIQANVAYFHKQNGGRSKCRCHGAWGCRLLDGRTWDEFPV